MSSDTSTVTLLFTDFVGSTALLERLGDEAADRVRREHFALLRMAVQEHGGAEIKSLGDGLMVAFPSAVAALSCAIAMQRAMAHAAGGAPMGLRVGLNAGEVISAEDDYFGAPVVVAKRLCDRADAGHIIVSGVVRALVGTRGGHAFADLGALQLKGFADPVAAFELDWASDRDVDRAEAAVQKSVRADVSDAATEPRPIPRSLAAEARTHLAGRADVVSVLQSQLDEARGGVLRIALIEGESGIGKTRVAADFAQRAAGQDVHVLFGRSDPEPLAPFQPFVEALTEYVEQTPVDRIIRVVGANASVLARMVPRLAQRLPGSAPPLAAADPEVERYRLLDAASSLLETLARAAPLLLVLDDLQWADRSTVALLRHLARALRDSRLLIVGTYQGAELRRDNGLGDFIAERHRGLPIRVTQLQGLSRAETIELAATWAGQALPPGLGDALWRETEGHPFFIGELLRNLLESGLLYEDLGRLHTSTSAERLELPASVRDVVEQRIGRLDDEVRDVLRVAAVAGREFDVQLVERVSGVSGDRLLRLLDVATAAGIVGPSPDSLDRYRFWHAMVRQSLYASLSPAWRVRLHQRIAEALEQMNPPDHELPHAELAEHYFAAAAGSEVFAKAIEHAIAAGHQAEDHLAYEEAAAHYERALRALEMDSKGDTGGRRCEVLLALADSQWALGEFARSRRTYADAADLAQTLRNADALARAALGFSGGIYFGIGLVDRAHIDLLERSLAMLDDTDSPLRARLLAHLCDAVTMVAPADRRRGLAAEAVAMARRVGDDDVLCDVLSRVMWGNGSPDSLEARLAISDELDHITARRGRPILRTEALIWLAATRHECGDIGAARRVGPELDTIAASAGQPYLDWLAWAYRTQIAMLDQPSSVLEPLVWQGLDTGRAAQNATSVVLFGAHLLYLRYMQGRLPESHAVALALADHFAAIPVLRLAYAFVCAEIGRLEQAQAEVAAFAAAGFRGLPRDVLWLTCMDLLSHICAVLEDLEMARAVYDLYEPFADRVIVLGTAGAPVGVGHRDLGVLLTVMGEYDTAANHFEAAWSREAELGLPHGRMITSHYFAEMLVRRSAGGDRDRAQRIIREMMPAAEAAGFGGMASKLRHVQRELKTERAARGTQSYKIANAKALVTKRGRDVVARMVAGRSNEDLQRRFGSALAHRVLFTAMAQGFQPRMAFGFEGAIQINLRRPGDATIDTWALAVSGDHAAARHETVPDPVATITTDVPTFMRIFAGELNPLTGFLDGLVDVIGDVTLGARLPELFGGVKPFRVDE